MDDHRAAMCCRRAGLPPFGRLALASAALTLAVATPQPATGAEDPRACAAAFDHAQEARDEGRYRDARRHFVACLRETCPTAIRNDCADGLTEIDRSAPTIVIGATDTRGRDLVFVRVALDGEWLLDRLDGRPVALDPGPHTLRFEAEGHVAREDRIVVRTGEKNRFVTARLELSAPAPSRSNLETTLPPAPRRAPSPFAWALGGGAALALTSSAVFGLGGLADKQDCKGRPEGRLCSDAEVATIDRKFVVADISLAVGLVSTALVAYVLLSSERRPARAPSGP